MDEDGTISFSGILFISSVEEIEGQVFLCVQ
jgi:hypothetical protein